MMEPNTTLRGVKQELTDFRCEFCASFEKLKDSIDDKFCINTRLDLSECNVKRSVTEEHNESIMTIKNSIIDALKEENLKLQKKVEE